MKRIIFLFLLFPFFTHAQLADNFFDEVVVENIDRPVGIVFDYEGFGYIWQKSGIIQLLDTFGNLSSENVLDISEEVSDYNDHGLMSIALDPDFNENQFLYVAYAVDRHHLLHYGTPNYSKDSTLIDQASIGRLTRYKVDLASRTAIPDSRTVLMGKTKENGLPILSPFHGVGAIQFGDDGSLLLSVGDGGHDQEVDGKIIAYFDQSEKDGMIEEKHKIGSFRSQMLDCYNGKILRLNPIDGSAYPSNPLYDPERPEAPISYVYHLGFRNPFSFISVEGTGSIYESDGNPGTLLVGDVGQGGWEELNVAQDPLTNFGWPDYEAFESLWPYHFEVKYDNLDAPNPLYGKDGCDREYFIFQDLITHKTKEEWLFKNPCDDKEVITNVPTFVNEGPVVAWSNALYNNPPKTIVPYWNEEGREYGLNVQETTISDSVFSGYSSIPGFWYQDGELPDTMSNSLFISDFSGWIKCFVFDKEFELQKIIPIADDVKGIVRMGFNQKENAIYYSNIATNTIHKITYGGNPKPIAKLTYDKQYGASPLTVNFDASESYDPKDEPLTYKWYSDGTLFSEEKSPQFTFVADNNDPQSFLVKLEVIDSIEQIKSAEVIISTNNTPPEVSINGAKDGDLYPTSFTTMLNLKANAMDLEEDVNQLTYEWEVFLHHNLHFHAEPIKLGNQLTTALEPLGCQDEKYWFRIRLTATDSYGLFDTDEIEVFPNCNQDYFGNVTWISAISGDSDIQLEWSQDNLNITKMDVERFSETGVYDIIGTVNKENQSTFSITDNNPHRGINSYRIKSYHENGNYDYSDFKMVKWPNFTTLAIFPNPVKSNLLVYPFEWTSSSVFVKIFDLSGRLILDRLVYADEWNNGLNLDVQDIPRGSYIIHVTINNKKHSKLFVKL